MTARWPDDLFDRVTELLIDHMGRVDDRDALLTESLWNHDTGLYRSIELEGKPNTFCTKCIRTLLEGSCVDFIHPLSRVLGRVRRRSGVERHTEIDYWINLLNDHCNTPKPIPNRAEIPVGPGRAPQSLGVPIDERGSTLYVSYAREDGDVAERIIRELREAGHTVWVDADSIIGSDDWSRSTSEGINNSYAVVVLCSSAAMTSQFVHYQWSWAQRKGKTIVSLLLEPSIAQHQGFEGLHRYPAISLERALREKYLGPLLAPLIALLPAPPKVASRSMPLPRRAFELEYLDWLRLTELLETERYTPLAAQAQVAEDRSPSTQITLKPVVMRPEFEMVRWRHEGLETNQPTKLESFEDAVQAMRQVRRAAVLGEPGAGKTTTLWRLARQLVDEAFADPKAALPILVRLGRWIEPSQPLLDFVASQMGELGAHLPDLLKEQRVVLLLDGLNEVPADERANKTQQIRRLMGQYPTLSVVITCREKDYTHDLGCARIAIQPLDATRILEFATRYLGQTGGERFFWRLVGSDRLQAVWQTWHRAGVSFETFFSANDIHNNVNTNNSENSLWREHVRNPRNLLVLARNPYLLFMLTQIYVVRKGQLPRNRGRLFGDFVDTLLLRERAASRDEATGAFSLTPVATILLAEICWLAYRMQEQSHAKTGRDPEEDEGGALTALPLAEVQRLLSPNSLALAQSANLLQMDVQVRFTHQLLQEYFAALHLRQRIDQSGVKASQFWPADRWWERTGWEETAILLAGLASDDCTKVVEWVAAANPEVAAQCIARSGAYLPIETQMRLRDQWLPHLTDLKRDPDPRVRAAMGRAIGTLPPINGLHMDTRKGVGNKNGIAEIDWVSIKAGPFLYGEKKEKVTIQQDFWIARYPVTYAQFQGFIDATDGFGNPQWWKGLSASEEHRATPGEQAFKFWNHPRERVSWYDAVAFCRWLSAKLGYEVRLPIEQEWERAARGPKGREYAYDGHYDANKANTEDIIGLTTAVGIYPNGLSLEKVADLTGNILEWCVNEHFNSTNVQLNGAEARVLRGGSWSDGQGRARASSRNYDGPGNRLNGVGFRLVCVRPLVL